MINKYHTSKTNRTLTLLNKVFLRVVKNYLIMYLSKFLVFGLFGEVLMDKSLPKCHSKKNCLTY